MTQLTHGTAVTENSLVLPPPGAGEGTGRRIAGGIAARGSYISVVSEPRGDEWSERPRARRGPGCLDSRSASSRWTPRLCSTADEFELSVDHGLRKAAGLEGAEPRPRHAPSSAADRRVPWHFRDHPAFPPHLSDSCCRPFRAGRPQHAGDPAWATPGPLLAGSAVQERRDPRHPRDPAPRSDSCGERLRRPIRLLAPRPSKLPTPRPTTPPRPAAAQPPRGSCLSVKNGLRRVPHQGSGSGLRSSGPGGGRTAPCSAILRRPELGSPPPFLRPGWI